MLTYSNAFGVFQGDDADAVLRAVHAEAARGEPSTYDDWWRYNQWVWREQLSWHLPDQKTPGASKAFLEKMVEAGALKAGAS
jgi:hypothetical protein